MGEIVAATSRDLVAQSVRLHEAPAFGSLVRVPVAAVHRTAPAGSGGSNALPAGRHDPPATTSESGAALTRPAAGAEAKPPSTQPTELYAIVSETRTASLEAGGRPIARGHEDVVDAAIYRENPDLEHVLRTEFTALFVGFRAALPSPPAGHPEGEPEAAPRDGETGREASRGASAEHQGAGGRVFQHLPPLPPPLHYSVYACTPAEIIAFTERLDFLRTLLAAPPGLADELAAASARAAAAARGGRAGEAFLLRVGRELAVLLRDDYDRLTAVLRRLRPTETGG